MKYSIYILTLFFALTACQRNPLDITPNGIITLDDVFADEQHTEAYLNTVYNYIPAYFYSYGHFGFLSAFSDEAQDAYLANTRSWNNGGLTPSSGGPNGFYSNWWRGIRMANEFLQNIDRANVPNEANRQRFKGEAKLLRAFYYFELIKQYGPMPVFEEAILPTYNFESIKRPSFQENVDAIVKDCNDAINNSQLPLRVSSQNEVGRFTKAAAYAIRSQALLFNASPLWNPDNNTAKWQIAATAAREAVTALTAGEEYILTPWEDYESYFRNVADAGSSTRDRETILSRPNANNGLHLVSYNGIPSKEGGRAGLCPSQELVDSYDMQETGEPAILGYRDEEHLDPIVNELSGYDPKNPYEGRDPRFYTTIWYNGATFDNIKGRIHTVETFLGGADQWNASLDGNVFNTHTGYYLRKFIDPKLQIGQSAILDWKLFRLAEIYLNLAEAENEFNGPTSIAYEAINAIRARVNMPNLPNGLTKEEFRNRVQNERRVELVFEEKRFWDVRRWKVLSQTDKLVTAMIINKLPDGSFSYERQVTERRDAWQDKYQIYPIPISEVSKVPDFSENQNPGW